MNRGWIFQVVILGLLAAASVRGEVLLSEVLTVLAEPVVIDTRTGQVFSGTVVEVTPEWLSLLTEAGGGTVEYTFSRSEVVQVTLPGRLLKTKALELAAGGNERQGLELIDVLFVHQAPFRSYLSPAAGGWFVETLPFYRLNGRLIDGLARAHELAENWALEPGSRSMLEDEILLSTLLAGRFLQAEKRADAWIERQPREMRSALGWFVLGTVQLRANEADLALFTFLRPVVFAGPTPVPFLAECYAGAIEAALALNQDSAATALYREMRSRKLAWPAEAPELPESFSALFP